MIGGNMQPDRTLTIEDLVTAFIDFDKNNGSSYYAKRLELLQSLFKCDMGKRERELDEESRGERRGQAIV